MATRTLKNRLPGTHENNWRDWLVRSDRSSYLGVARPLMGRKGVCDMGGLSLPHLIVMALVVLVLFGRGRISEMMGDFGKGIKSFKQGMHEEDNKPIVPPAQIQQQQVPPATPAPQPTSTTDQAQ